LVANSARGDVVFLGHLEIGDLDVRDINFNADFTTMSTHAIKLFVSDNVFIKPSLHVK
jgi:hypothetical protein